MHRHEITDEQWALVELHIPLSKARTGRPSSDPRLMLNGIFWVLCTGAPWRDLPDRFGPWQTVYDHFRKWRRSGVFAKLIDALQIRLDAGGLIDSELWCVDGAIVRAAAGADKKVSADTPTNRQTTRWAAAEAGLDPSSTWLLTAKALRWRSSSPPGRRTNPLAPNRSSGKPSRL
jgi:transposase